MAQPAPARQYYPALDGLRGVAILLVVVYHNFGFINYFFFGWLGVDLFFVLSGFLITGILLNTQSQKNYLGNFYRRRILRIFPLYYLVLAICLFIVPLFKNIDLDLSYYSKNQLWFWVYLQNWLYIIKLPSNNILIHFWSLAVEEQFYLLWPFLILWIKYPKRLFIVAAGILLTVICCRYAAWFYKIETISYFSLYTFTRIDGICVGCMIALLQRFSNNFLEKYTTSIVLSLAGFNFLFYFINSRYQFSFPYLALIGYTTFAVILGFFVYQVTTQKTKIIDWILNLAVLKFFGKISYGLYVFHWPVNILLTPLLMRNLFPIAQVSISGARLITAFVVTGISILISFLSYKYFESYFLRFKTRYL
ncbi:MAG: acyltransferase [Chitinophagaceae bacterium]